MFDYYERVRHRVPLRKIRRFFRNSRASQALWTWVFLRRFRNWTETREQGEKDHHKMLRAFLATGGSPLSRAALISNQSNGHHLFKAIVEIRQPFDVQSSSNRQLNELRRFGYCIMPDRLNPAIISELHASFGQGALKMVSDNPQVNGRYEMIDWRLPKAERYDVSPQRILENHYARELLLDVEILKLVQDYLGSVPIIDIVTAWYSFPVGRSSSEAATQFHFDLDRSKWLKVFYFLSDVDEESGPHVFIQGSHRDNGIPKEFLREGYTRFSDELVESRFSRDDWSVITAPAGTILIEDTRGLHKGLPVVSGHRAVLQFQYSVDLFGSPSHLSEYNKNVFDGEPLVSQVPTLFSAFARNGNLSNPV